MNTNATVNTMNGIFTTKEVAEMLKISLVSLNSYIHKHPEIAPKCKNGRSLVWTMKDIERIYNHRSNNTHYRIKQFSLPSMITPTTTTLAVTANQNSALVDMFNEFINIEHEEFVNENRAANRKFKYFFERMTEKDLQKFFTPLLERFKYSYVTRHVNNVQSQTLTCIKRGTLKGIKKYELTYAAFLELCKFAADNNCPLDFSQINEEM